MSEGFQLSGNSNLRDSQSQPGEGPGGFSQAAIVNREASQHQIERHVANQNVANRNGSLNNNAGQRGVSAPSRETPDTSQEHRELRKSSSMGSLYISTTICKPCVDSIINSVATILHSQMIEDLGQAREIRDDTDLFFFTEEKYIMEKPEAFDQQRIQLLRETPSVEQILDFIKALYDCAKFSPECCIICLIYINRLIAFTEIPLQPTNWRPLVLCSLLVAQKVWDDRYLSNSDFAFIYPFFMTEQLNRLEKKFLELIQYNVTVKSSLYAKYYFELRALFKDNEKEFPLVPIDRSEEQKLEIDLFGHRENDLAIDVEQRLNSSFGGITSKPFLQQLSWE